jgi:hypothetical protein
MSLSLVLSGAPVDRLLELLGSISEDHKGIVLQALHSRTLNQNISEKEESISKLASFILKTKSASLLPTLISLLNSLEDGKSYLLLISKLLHYNLDGLKNWPNSAIRVSYLLLRNRPIEKVDHLVVREIFAKNPKFLSQLDVAVLVKFKSFLKDQNLLFDKLMKSDEFFNELCQIYFNFKPSPLPDILVEINNLLFVSNTDLPKQVYNLEHRITSSRHIGRLVNIIIFKETFGNYYLEWIKFKYGPLQEITKNESLLFYFLDRIEGELRDPERHPEASKMLLRLGDSLGCQFINSFQNIVIDLLKKRPRNESFFILPLITILKKFKLSDIDWLINYLSSDDLEVRLEVIEVILRYLNGESSQEVRLPLVAKAWDAIAKRNDRSILRLHDFYVIEPDFLSHRVNKLTLQCSSKYIKQVLEKIKI